MIYYIIIRKYIIWFVYRLNLKIENEKLLFSNKNVYKAGVTMGKIIILSKNSKI